VEAQLPGARTAPRDRVRAEFISNVLGELNETRDAWADAVENDDVEPLVELYTEDAVVIPPDGIPRRGEEEIREYWAEALPRMGTFQTGLSDVDGSGRMVMAWGSYLLNERGDDNVFAQLSGSLMNVYVKTGGSWRIRGQVFGKPE
jgi:ketosteroid isomerase-like protein